MSARRPVLSALFACASLLAPMVVSAHAHLLVASPADHFRGPAPAHIDMSFSEALLTPVSGAELVLTAMPGMSMGPVKVPVKTSFGDYAKSMSLIPARPLIPGSYRVDWHVVSADTHPRKGSFSFQVQ